MNTTKPISAITRINKQLKAQGREERLVKGRGGYYYLKDGEASRLPATSIYTSHIGPRDYLFAALEVCALLRAGKIAVTFEGCEEQIRRSIAIERGGRP
jgi:hypothetical protein